MHTIKAEYPTDWEDANIYVCADWHIGDQHCDMQAVKSQIAQIQNDPHGLCILNGDLINTALKTSVSDIYGEVLAPMEAITQLVDLLSPIKDKIIGVTTGNHEARVYRNDGVDIMRLVCRQLDVEDRYNPDGVLIFLRLGTQSPTKKGAAYNSTGKVERNPRQLFTIYVTHGSGGGRKEGGKAIRLADMAAVVDSDIYIHAHTHLPMIMRESFYRTSTANNTARLVDKLFVNTASFLDYGGYGQAQEFKPSSKLTPTIHLNPLKALATATL